MNWLASRTIGPDDLRHDGNSFTALRWILASSVMISHGWDLTQSQRGLDPTVAILSFPISRLAVFLFFTLSGFLVIGSLVKRGVWAFLQARALRLLPGLWIMLLVIPLLLGLAFGSLPIGHFLADGETHRFVWRNAALIGGAYRLPGVFDTAPLPNIVNGSLWTIPHEVRCYLALAVMGGLGLTLSRKRFTLLILIGMAAHLVAPEQIVPLLYDARRLAFAFFLGVLAWLWRDRLPLSWPLAIAGAGLALALPGDAGLKTAVSQIGFGYLALVAAFRVPAGWKAASARLPDYSYGIYIYAFAMQQVALALGAREPLPNIGLAFVLTIPLAALSWHFVEKPALGLKPVGPAQKP